MTTRESCVSLFPGGASSQCATRTALFVELLDRLGEARLRVLGASMLPAIWPGDTLTVRRCPMAHASNGDVVLATRDGRLFAHRVIASGDSRLLTRGDALDDIDPPVSAENFLGVVVGVARPGVLPRPQRRRGLAKTIVATAGRRLAVARRLAHPFTKHGAR